MASGDFLELAQRACYMSRRDISDSTDLTRAKEAVNLAMMTVCTSGDPWEFLEREGAFTLTTGSDVYTYASIATAIGMASGGIDEIIALVIDSQDIDNRPLKSMSWTALEAAVASTRDNEANGTPEFWSKWNSTIRVFPAPDQAYTLGCLVRTYPDEMSGDTDTPPMPLSWRHQLLVPHAAATLLREEGGAEAHSEANILMADYQAAFMRARTALATARQPTFEVMSPGWENQPI